MGSALVPHITEYLWNAFVRKFERNEAESVHLTLLPQVNERYIDEKLEGGAFDLLFAMFSDIAEMRNRIKVKLRWPPGKGGN